MTSAERILSAVAAYYNLRLGAMRSNGRRRPLTVARHVACYLLRDLTSLPLEEIARQVGRTNHTTALHSVRTVQAWMDVDPVFKSEVEGLRCDLAPDGVGRYSFRFTN